jgi:hypothetical protein
MQQVENPAVAAAKNQADAYRDGEDRPLGGYVAVMAVFASLVAAAVGLALATGRRLPSSLGPWDVLLLAAGTHKLSRTVSKNAVTSPLRAPFTRYKNSLHNDVRRVYTGQRLVLVKMYGRDRGSCAGLAVGTSAAPAPRAPAAPARLSRPQAA